MATEMTEPIEKEVSPPPVGINFDDLEGVFEDIIKLYFDIAGGREADYLRRHPEYYEQKLADCYSGMREALDPNSRGQGRHHGMVLGSRLDDHSKLEFFAMDPYRIARQEDKKKRIIKMNFYPNGLVTQEAEQMSKDVNEAIAGYLEKKNLAIPLNP